jgi:DNA mismatch repair protein MutS
MASANLYEVYNEFHKKYSAKFGAKTAIFMLVGSFYELYAIQEPETGECNFNIKEITDYLGIQIAYYKGQLPGKKDGMIAGFPDYALHKWAGRMTSAGWTIVVVDQKKDSKGRVSDRVLTRILSPSTHIENISAFETPFLTTIYFYNTSVFNAPHFGIASLDLTTGQTISYSGQAAGRADFWTADTLVQNLSIFQPREVLVYWHSTTSKCPSNIRTILGLNESIQLYIRPIDTIGTFSKPTACAEYLQKSFAIKSLLPPREYLGLRTQYEELALLYLLQFVEEHMPSTSHKITRNEAWIPNMQLICGNHALSQLQVFSGAPGEMSVVNLFSGILTPMGRRGITQRLLRPQTSSIEIQNRLDEIEEYLSWTPDKKSSLQKHLRFCFDIPRLHRKILMATIGLSEFSSLYQTYNSIDNIITLLGIDSELSPTFSTEPWDTYKAMFMKHIDSKKSFECNSSNQDLTPFVNATYPEIAKTEEEIKKTIEGFDKERQRICEMGGLPGDALRLEAREKEPFGIKATATQIKFLQSNKSSLSKDTHLSVLKSGGWIDTQVLSDLNSKLMKLRDTLVLLSNEALLNACNEISNAGTKILYAVEEWITHIDVTQAIACTCQKLGFCKPKIVHDSKTSYVEIKSLRHPLVEATGTRVYYVQHDISLGKNDDSRGYLIYGMNASGKSTLMKATGVAVLLAQAGVYVPAKEMELAPFRAIYTRILNHDNLFAGLSSFAVEMSELRDILSSADHQTLVLGDELCSGTESISAEALVASGIQWLSNQSAKFMFATHLHHLSKLLEHESKELGLKIFHLHVDYDPVTKKLIYDRSLREGSGSSLYGLEVARAMDLPLEFIEMALANRHKIMGSRTQSTSKSTDWSSEIVCRKCEVCEKGIVSELEVHHIEERHLADKDGILPTGKPMNNASNLIVLCKECHDKIHSGKIEVAPLVQTSSGPERVDLSKELDKYKYVATATKPTSTSKWTDDEIKVIHEMLLKYKSASIKAIQIQLKQQYGIEIGLTSLGKMKKELDV